MLQFFANRFYGWKKGWASPALDGVNVLNGQQERLLQVSHRVRNLVVDGVHQLDDRLFAWNSKQVLSCEGHWVKIGQASTAIQ